jgi:hypothetical protein
VAFGLLAVACLYAVGSSSLDRRGGLLASALLALSQYHAWYSQEARLYALLALLSVAALYAYGRAAAGPQEPGGSVRVLGPLFLAAGALAYTHVYGALVLAGLMAEAAWAWLGSGAPERRRRGGVLLALGLAALCLLPWALRIPDMPAHRFAHLAPFSWDRFHHLLGSLVLKGGALPAAHRLDPGVWGWPLWAAVVAAEVWVLGLLALGLLRLLRSGPGAGRAAAVTVVVVLGGSVILSMGVQSILRERVLTCIVGPLCLALAAGTCGRRRRRLHELALLGLQLLYLGLCLARPDERSIYVPNPDWRGLVSRLKTEVGPRDLVVLTSPPDGLVYYWSRPPRRQTTVGVRYIAVRSVQQLRDAVRSVRCRDVFLVQERRFQVFARSIVPRLGAEPIERFELKGLDVQRHACAELAQEEAPR